MFHFILGRGPGGTNASITQIFIGAYSFLGRSALKMGVVWGVATDYVTLYRSPGVLIEA